MKTYRITLSELNKIEIDIEANSEEKAEKKLHFGGGWNYGEDAEVRNLEVSLEDIEQLDD